MTHAVVIGALVLSLFYSTSFAADSFGFLFAHRTGTKRAWRRDRQSLG